MLFVLQFKVKDGSDTVGTSDCQADIKLPEPQIQSRLKLHARMAHQYPVIVKYGVSQKLKMILH